MRVEHAALTAFHPAVLVAVGLDERDAATVAGSLVAADLRGVATHGVLRLPVYVERMRRGLPGSAWPRSTTATTSARRAGSPRMAGLALTHAEADVVPFGGRRAALGTNPLAVAVPRGDGPPILLDMATSGVAMGKVLLARKQGRPIPEDWGVDADGEPTTDPERVRAVRPLGGPRATVWRS